MVGHRRKPLSNGAKFTIAILTGFIGGLSVIAWSNPTNSLVLLGVYCGLMVAGLRNSLKPNPRFSEDSENSKARSVKHPEDRDSRIRDKVVEQPSDNSRPSHYGPEKDQERFTSCLEAVAQSNLDPTVSVAQKETHYGIKGNIGKCRGEYESPTGRVDHAGGNQYDATNEGRSDLVIGDFVEGLPERQSSIPSIDIRSVSFSRSRVSSPVASSFARPLVSSPSPRSWSACSVSACLSLGSDRYSYKGIDCYLLIAKSRWQHFKNWRLAR